MGEHETASRDEWRKRRAELLEKEKAHKRASDALAEARRALPWVKVEADHCFDGWGGDHTLANLFGEASQLIVYHFMFAAGWDKPCPSCSFWADHFTEGVRDHLARRDVRLVVVSAAPRPTLEAWAEKAGWSFPWFSSAGSAFNTDFDVTLDEANADRTYNFKPTEAKGEMPGLSCFVKTHEGVFHTYSAYARGLEPLNSTYGILDLVPRGRDEGELDWAMQWVVRRAEE